MNNLKEKSFFDRAMTFRSDANPFDEDGSCIVKDGYSHCKRSVNEYIISIENKDLIPDEVTNRKEYIEYILASHGIKKDEI